MNMPVDLPMPPPNAHSLGSAFEKLSAKWGWLAAFGAILLALGLTALVLVGSATIATVLVNGVFMIAAGAAEIFIGASSKTWSRFFLWIAAGLLYLVAGSFLIANPVLGSAILTLLLGFGLLASGLVRIFLGFELADRRPANFIMFSGVLTALLGMLIIIGWPANSVFVLGLLLGVDLTFYGLNCLALSLRLRRWHLHSR
jgi:uncharacterized membrane protein HdeD (DUF308 family)